MATPSTGMKEAAIELHARIADAPAADVEAAIKEFWQTWGTVPRRPVDLVARRRQALRELRGEGERQGFKLSHLARRYGFTANRFSRLTSIKNEEAAA